MSTSSSTSVYVYLSKRIFLLRDYRHAPHNTHMHGFFFIQNYFDKQNFVRNANQREQNKVRKEYRTSKGWAIVINPLSAVSAYRCLAKAIGVD